MQKIISKFVSDIACVEAALSLISVLVVALTQWRMGNEGVVVEKNPFISKDEFKDDLVEVKDGVVENTSRVRFWVVLKRIKEVFLGAVSPKPTDGIRWFLRVINSKNYKYFEQLSEKLLDKVFETSGLEIRWRDGFLNIIFHFNQEKIDLNKKTILLKPLRDALSKENTSPPLRCVFADSEEIISSV